VKDQLGNDLQIGDVVMAKVENVWITGVVLKIQGGGLSLAGTVPKNGQPMAGQQSPDLVVLQVGVVLTGRPGFPQPGIVRVDAPNQVTTMVENSVKM
jgi:hypothetical protein